MRGEERSPTNNEVTYLRAPSLCDFVLCAVCTVRRVVVENVPGAAARRTDTVVSRYETEIYEWAIVRHLLLLLLHSRSYLAWTWLFIFFSSPWSFCSALPGLAPAHAFEEDQS